jgi:hypothetical protein
MRDYLRPELLEDLAATDVVEMGVAVDDLSHIGPEASFDRSSQVSACTVDGCLEPASR